MDVFTLVGKFRIYGSVRFLSHQETMRVIARAIVRSGIPVVYTQGFNPHPKLSLPLPRNVGLASDDELFYAGIQKPIGDSFIQTFARQLPQGFELISIETVNRPVIYEPVEVEYLITPSEITDKFISNIRQLNERIRTGCDIIIHRKSDKNITKTINATEFLKLLDVTEWKVRILCNITSAGTIRPDEILTLIGMQPYEVSSSILRKAVKWQVK